MRKRRIINIALVITMAISVFLTVKFDIVGRIKNTISQQVVQNKAEKAVQEDLIYETSLDKDGNEYLVEMKKTTGEDEDGNKMEFYADTAEAKIIYSNMYKGTIEKIEDNKIYFMVDKKSKNGSYFCEDVEDYEIVFDIDTYDFKSDPISHYWVDSLCFDYKDFYSAGELKFLVGESLRVQDSMSEDCYTGDRYKILDFYLQ